MTLDYMVEQFTQRFELEIFPPTRWDAAQAVLYRVGEPLDLRGQDEWSPACREALTARLLPRQRGRRKRWISAVLLEKPMDLDQPPHMRPALATAAGLSLLLPGGLLIEQLPDLGEDPIHRAVVITWLAERAGFPSRRGEEDVAPDKASNPVGTFTVGDLGRPNAARRFGSTARTDLILQEHVRRLNATAMRDVRNSRESSLYRDLYRLFNEAAIAAVNDNAESKIDFCIAEHTLRSQLLPDLGKAAAQDEARQMRAKNIHPDRVWQTLQLAGFINPKENRLWYRELVEGMAGKSKDRMAASH